MNIGFVGAGKVGCSFGHYLKQQDISIVGYCSRSRSSSLYATNLTRSSPFDLYQLVKKSDHIFITTPDDEIKNVWNQMQNYDLEGKKIFHMSGCLSSDIFNNWKDKKAFCYSLHPLFSFTRKTLSKLENVIFSIEGEDIGRIEKFLYKANIKYFVIEKEQKPLYHASAVFVSNYLVSLAKIGENLLVKCGLDKTQSVDGIYPLMKSVLNNIKEKGIDNSLTGPIARGDIETVEKHVGNLHEYKEIYGYLGEIALEIAKNNQNLSDEKINKLYKILRGDYNEKNCIDI